MDIANPTPWTPTIVLSRCRDPNPLIARLFRFGLERAPLRAMRRSEGHMSWSRIGTILLGTASVLSLPGCFTIAEGDTEVDVQVNISFSLGAVDAYSGSS